MSICLHAYRQQKGSALALLIVLVVLIGGAVWLVGLDRIKQYITGESEKPPLEMVSLKCEGSGALGGCKGTVRNVSPDPLQLIAFVLIKRDNFPDERLNASVLPSPLQPGQTGAFQLETMFDASKDICEVLWFKDGNKKLGYVRPGEK